ncbi:MAG TPA: phosphatase PAP2 family protein [Sphingomicrobium sp.]|nr:phosphatase PAP2 family protein [Sphingomicrobium sp.]
MKVAVSAIIAAQFVAALLIEAFSGFRYSPPWLFYLLGASGMIVLSLAGLTFFWLSQLERAKVMNKREIVLARLKSSDLPFIYWAVAAQFCLLGWLKAAMPFSVGFQADQLLADADAWIFFGTDPWRLVQWLPPTLIDTAYVTWAQSTLFMMAVLPLFPKSPKRDRAMISFFLVVSASAILQYALPSAGPIFYERLGFGDRFADLPSRPWATITSDYLWANYLDNGSRVGAGISAFPSLHVAGAAWVAAVVTSFSRKLGPVAWAYFGLILLGSVYLGWHYALDGIAGLVIALVMYRVVSLSNGREAKLQPASGFGD